MEEQMRCVERNKKRGRVKEGRAKNKSYNFVNIVRLSVSPKKWLTVLAYKEETQFDKSN